MYPVSEAFKVAMKKAQRVEHVRGYIGSVSFDDHNVISMNYSNQCSDNKDVTLGSARIGQLNAIFYGLNIPRGSWRGKTLTLEYGLTLADESVEYVPAGVFTIASADWTETGVNVVAYDCLSKLDGAFGLSTTTGKIYDFIKLTEELTGVPCGLTKAECESLPNGDELLGLYVENDVKTVRDFVGHIGTVAAGFVTASRTGSLLVKSFADSEVVDSFESRERIVGSVFSDFTTQYDGINIVDIASGTTEYYYGEGETGGVSISIGSNPLLQYGTDQVKARQRKAIADVVVDIKYTPFAIALLNCPVYDLGDLIQCSGGVAGSGSVTCCVMGIDWTFKNTINLRGFGADPNLASGKSKTDKALAGLSSKSSENSLVTHTYINAQEYDLGNHQNEPIVGISFATIKPCIVKMYHEVNIDLDVLDPSAGATVTAYYYLNDELQGYKPVDTFYHDGKYIVPLMYFLETLSGGTAYDWNVELRVDGGTAVIERGDVHAWLEGQGLVAVDEFAGTIHCEDIYTPLVLDRELATIIDTVVALDLEAIGVPLTIQDVIDITGIGRKDLATIYDSNVAVEFAYAVYALITDDDFAFITDDGYTLLNSDGGYS